MSIVDFTEISTPMDWELFAQAFFRSRGWNIVEGPSMGSDGGTGKDLIIEEVKETDIGPPLRRRFLVSCKHYANREKNGSVKEGDEKNSILTNIELEDCDGFIGFYSTFPSAILVDNLNKLAERKGQIIEIFDKQKIEEYLLLKEKGNELLKIYFKKSYKEWVQLGKKNIEQNTNFKKLTEDDFKTTDKDYYKKYYEGQPVQWSIIRKYTFKRDSFDYIVKQLDANKIALVTGAGGEGKTTLLMQVGDHYLNSGYQIFYCFDSVRNLNMANIKFKPSQKYLLIVDNANTIENITEFVTKIKLTPGVKVLLASRKNEWLYFLSSLTDCRDLLTMIGKETTLHKLSETELSELSNLLKKHKVLNEEVEQKLPDFLNENTDSNFLLSVMVYATQGKSFDQIIADVTKKLQNWENSELTINAIGYIVCIEVLGRGPHGTIYCHEGMLKKLLKISYNKQYRTIIQHLAQEAFFQGSIKNHIINTRNPIIAKLYFDCLFNADIPILDKYTFYYDILRVASISNNKFDRDILSLIPKYNYDKDRELAISLLKDAISFGFFWNTYNNFIDDEIKKRNIGDYETEQFSARWLFRQAYSKNPKDSTLYLKWAQFELRNGNIGEVNLIYTVRWILHQGIKICPSASIFTLWAKTEVKFSNIGRNVDDLYTARWLCKEGCDLFGDHAIYEVWAKIESQESNIGKSVDELHTARWVCKQGCDVSPNHSIFAAWAKIEANVKNFGKDVNDLYTVRWICKQGCDLVPNPGIFTAWATIEVSVGNIGKNVDELHSARWIYKYGCDVVANPNLFSAWANMEANINNIGKNVEDPYSARWICKQGAIIAPGNGLFTTWANIEKKIGNIGENVDEPYSARWICKQALDKTPEIDVFMYWAKMEKTLGNIGSITIPYSSRWILKYGFDKTNSESLVYAWLRFEIENDNIGSSIEPYSAQYLFDHYLKMRETPYLVVKDIKISDALELKQHLAEVDITQIDDNY